MAESGGRVVAQIPAGDNKVTDVVECFSTQPATLPLPQGDVKALKSSLNDIGNALDGDNIVDSKNSVQEEIVVELEVFHKEMKWSGPSQYCSIKESVSNAGLNSKEAVLHFCVAGALTTLTHPVKNNNIFVKLSVFSCSLEKLLTISQKIYCNVLAYMTALGLMKCFSVKTSSRAFF